MTLNKALRKYPFIPLQQSKQQIPISYHLINEIDRLCKLPIIIDN